MIITPCHKNAMRGRKNVVPRTEGVFRVGQFRLALSD
jgi:hypothetical protein